MGLKRHHLALASVVGSLHLAAQEMPVPAELQGEILSRVLHYDRALESVPEVRVLLVYSVRPPAFREELLGAFEAAGYATASVEVGELRKHLLAASVVYLAPGVDPDSVASAVLEAGLLSLTGIPRHVEEGRVAVSVGIDSGRPRILVNLDRLELEGHQLSSDLLKLVRVVGRK